MKVKTPAGDRPDAVVREITSAVDAWAPSGADFDSIVRRARGGSAQALKVYLSAMAAMVVILVASVAVMSAFNVGVLADQPAATRER